MISLLSDFTDVIWFMEYCVMKEYIGVKDGRYFKTQKARDKGFNEVVKEYHESGYPTIGSD